MSKNKILIVGYSSILNKGCEAMIKVLFEKLKFLRDRLG